MKDDELYSDRFVDLVMVALFLVMSGLAILIGFEKALFE